MQPYSTWRPSAGQYTSPSRAHPLLAHHASLLDLHHDQGNQWARSDSPSTSSSSSSSAYDGALTPTAGSSDENNYTPSRSTTPKPPPTPPPEFRTHLFGQYSRNPFYRNSRPSPPCSPKSQPSLHYLPDSYTPPESESRSPTPVAAPIPMRPIAMSSPNTTSGFRFDSGHSSPSTPNDEAPSIPPTAFARRDHVEDFLPPPSEIGDYHILHRKFMQNAPTLIRRKGWSWGDMIVKWLVRQPKTTLLLWICGELDVIPKIIFHYTLDDSMLPWKESDVTGIVSDPARILKEQWRSGILKNLPRDGRHVEFQTQDTVPLIELGMVGPPMPSTVKKRSKIKYLDGFDNCFYVRKRLEVPPDRPRDKYTIINQIETYRTKLDHTNIAKIKASYAQGQVVAFIMPHAAVNLATFLEGECTGSSGSDQIIIWVKELASGLAYIHKQGMEHKSIRPEKILVDLAESRIFYTVFGVCHPMRKTGNQLFSAFSNDPSYIYAAPEVIAGHKVDHRQADTFSLGTVFLEMVNYAKSRTSEELRDFRSARSHDISYHANIDRVGIYINLLRSAEIHARNKAKKERIRAETDNILLIVKGMLMYEARRRPTMERAEQFLHQGIERRRRVQARRPSFGARSEMGTAPSQSAVFTDLASLQSYYAASLASESRSVYGGN